ncbi:hypothetical protein [Paracoccus sp. (in: a-proteobacteria)]|uniref:hypothetical protein n=1 Tax=Paracoccus sp. TaxID=267 RepID=UPI003A87D8EA
MNRRHALAAIPVVLAAPALVASAPQTPVAALFRDIARLRTAINDNALSDGQMGALYDLMMDQSARLAVEPARDCRDWTMKVMALTDSGQAWAAGLAPGIWAEARALIGGA